MPWRYHGLDSSIEVIVTPHFEGDLMKLASNRLVWIVDTEQNLPIIQNSWRVGSRENLCEINRYPVRNEDDRRGNLRAILGSLDDHYIDYNIIVHGIEYDQSAEEMMAQEGFTIIKVTKDGFAAMRTPGVRERLIGRNAPASKEK